MSLNLFSVSLALRSAGTPSLVPANLAGYGGAARYDDRLPTLRDDDREPESCPWPEVGGLG